MADQKTKQIPAWQQDSEPSSSQKELPDDSEKNAGNSEPPNEPEPQSRTALLDQAAQFLRHDDIREAHRERKVSFLESKGLTEDEIHQLLDTSAADSSSSSSSSSSTSSTADPSTTNDSSTATTTTSTSVAQPSPPIITYPEFLLHAARPPPLITTPRLLSALYATALTSATVYGANTYLFNPMLASLTAARHSLFATTTTNLSSLTAKLEGVVSTIPPPTIGRGISDDDEETESEVSDPAELFHRDVGVQTSPSLANHSTSQGGPEKEPSTQGPTDTHTSRLHSLRDNLRSLSESGLEALNMDEEARHRVSELQGYLEDLAYGGRSRENGFGIGVVGNNAGNGGREGLDEVAKLKQEIKSMKGVLLSARNFPAGGLGRGRIGVGA